MLYVDNTTIPEKSNVVQIFSLPLSPLDYVPYYQS